MVIPPNESRQKLISAPGELRACINAHGLYNSLQFVLRLSPETHRLIESLPTGIVTGVTDFEAIRAFSTYLHETIHWWQHIGSTCGFMLSLSYPAQAHANYAHLKNFAARIGPKKSILRWVETNTAPGGPATPPGLAHTIVNNHFDIEHFRTLITNPGATRQVVDNPLFDCVGHSYEITYDNVILVLEETNDGLRGIFPNPRDWEAEFHRLRDQKQRGYYFGSDVAIVPIGAHALFEGQARFAQLQYLHFASGSAFEWDQARSRGMLEGNYLIAFDTFLEHAELEWPPSINHPVVALFLLVCDMAINPTSGFPVPIRTFNTFIEDVDPGCRFLFLCRIIANKLPHLATAITTYSRDEYVAVTEALARYLLVEPPLAVAETALAWIAESEPLKSLMAQHRTFEYSGANLPVRVLLSCFLALNADKFARPEFFCWPGAWMTGERVSTEIEALFEEHSALFVDKQDDDGTFPRLIKGRQPNAVHEMFSDFYAFNVTYDMTRQWIVTAGPFEYDYHWLSSSGTESDFKVFADRHFEAVYGVHPDSFEIL